MKNIKALLNKINKPAVKVIQSPDGDIIDCVPFHLQPAFDHPLLKGEKTMRKPPKAPSSNNTFAENFQIWTMSGERCPGNTIPIRRTTAQDILKAKSVETFGRKTVRKNAGEEHVHEHAVGYANGIFLGAKATINVWYPHVAKSGEFSLAQIWVTSGSLDSDLNTMEAGWQKSPIRGGTTREVLTADRRRRCSGQAVHCYWDAGEVQRRRFGTVFKRTDCDPTMRRCAPPRGCSRISSSGVAMGLRVDVRGS
ncbi:hypothetical protein STAS_28923 [Striga asiatica]|uniref:Neprosin PEP catalytic domain-containing protein n=1 Tax=Striga asiatica TaxID=4170 RepID=A0A5A7R1F6_STRAF|nr:hypothetical protein STAS_28923 [Striga asiatica]